VPGWLGAGIRSRSDQQIDCSRVQFPTPQLIYFLNSSFLCARLLRDRRSEGKGLAARELVPRLQQKQQLSKMVHRKMLTYLFGKNY